MEQYIGVDVLAKCKAQVIQLPINKQHGSTPQPNQWAQTKSYNWLDQDPISDPIDLSFQKEKSMCMWNLLRLHMWKEQVRVKN